MISGTRFVTANIAAQQLRVTGYVTPASCFRTRRQNDVLSTGRHCPKHQYSKLRSLPSIRRRIVDLVGATGVAQDRPHGSALVLHRLIVYVGNARGQNPVHRHSFKGGTPARVFRRCPAAVRRRTDATATGRTSGEATARHGGGSAREIYLSTER